MATKLKTYMVDMRFEVWFSTEVRAASIEDALAGAKEMGIADFVTEHKETEFVDCTLLPGLGVREKW